MKLEEGSGTVGPYRLEAELGRGGMGVVYRAYDARLDRRVAVKHLRPDVVGGDRRRARFRREARAAGRLSHPAVVQVHDLVEGEDGDWIVMELVEGPTVAEVLKEGPLPVARAADVGRRVAEGLAAAHARGIVHRDLKAENVKLPDDHEVKILDFGLAKDVGGAVGGAGEPSLTRSGQLLGTLRAMSPEQVRGGEVDARTDLFSLGVLLYEMLTGGSPFLADTGADTLSRVLSHRPPSVAERRSGVPGGLSELVDRLLSKGAEGRPDDAAEVARELAAFAQPHAVPGPRVSTPDDAETLVSTSDGSYAAWPSVRDPADAPTLRSRRIAAASILLLGLAAAALFLAGKGIETLRGADVDAGAPARPRTAYDFFRAGMGALERYERPGAVDEAVEAFQRALALDSESAAAYAGLARAYWHQYDFASRDPHWLTQARAAAERAVELNDHLALARISRGLVAVAQGRHEEAEADFELALTLEPGSADAHRGLAVVHAARGELAAAEASYRRALELRPGDRELHDLLGSLLFREGRYDEAETAFRRSVELAPEAVIGYRNLSASLYMQGRYEEAAAAIQSALEIEELPTLYTNLGAIFFNQGLYQQAVTTLEKALDVSGGSHDYRLWANLGDAYRWTPDNEERSREAYGRAIELLGPHLERRPDDPSLASRLALFEAKRGRCAAAGEALDRGDAAAADASTRFRRAVALEVCGRREEALEELGRALDARFSRVEVEADPELLDLRADRRYRELGARPPVPGPSPPPTTTSGSNA